jgi:hypothetical protein
MVMTDKNLDDFKGLSQATYILKCLSEGYSKDQIYSVFNGDIQLVSIWIDFLKDKHWIEKEGPKDVTGSYDETKLKVSENGKKWLESMTRADWMR